MELIELGPDDLQIAVEMLNPGIGLIEQPDSGRGFGPLGGQELRLLFLLLIDQLPAHARCA